MIRVLCFFIVLLPTCALAAPGDLLLTIPNPDGPNQIGAALFGASLASSEDLLLIGAPGAYLGINSGSVHLFNLATGEHLLTIRNPESTNMAPAHFGAAVAFHDHHIVVGAPAGGLTSSPGPTYVFDGDNGNQLFAFAPTSRDFGSTLTSNDHDILVGAPDAFSGTGAVYAFNATTGSQRSILRNPRPSVTSNFGSALTNLDSKIVIGSPSGTGHVFLFYNSGCYNLLGTIPDPDPSANRQFGTALTSVGQNFLVGAPPNSWTDGGAVYLYNSSGKSLLPIIDNDPGFGMAFGEDVVAVKDNFLVTAPGNLFGGGDAFLFDGETGDLLLTLPNTIGFDGTVTGVGNNIAIATPTLTLGTLQTIRIYEGYHVPEPQSHIITLIAIGCLALYFLFRRPQR